MSGKSAKRLRKQALEQARGGPVGRQPQAQTTARQQRGGQQVTAQFVQQTIEQFSGPLPAPQMLQGYENVVPGAAGRILTLAEDEAIHRRGMDRSFVRYRGWSLAAATLICLVLFVGGIYLTATGQSTEGLTLLVIEVVGLITVFLVTQFRG